MEATSDDWTPVFYLLEAHGFETWLVNARDVKHLPGPAEDRQTGRGLVVHGRRAAADPAQLRAAAQDPAAARRPPLPG
jgi:transposase